MSKDNIQQERGKPISPEEMTIESATQELRAIARDLNIDFPNDANYSERLRTVADFLVQLDETLQDFGIRLLLNKE